MSFSDDPQLGMVSDHFTGSATAQADDAVVRDADRRAALSAPLELLPHIRCRPREREDPYAVPCRCGTASDTFRKFEGRGLWAPAFARRRDDALERR